MLTVAVVPDGIDAVVAVVNILKLCPEELLPPVEEIVTAPVAAFILTPLPAIIELTYPLDRLVAVLAIAADVAKLALSASTA